MRKLKYEYVKDVIEGEGYTLLSDTYKNNATGLLVRCPEGHEYDVRFGNFQQGKRCPLCFGTQKHPYTYVKEIVESEGDTLLSHNYDGNKAKLEIRCPNGHEYNATFINFKFKKSRCPICAFNRHKLPYEYVKDFIEGKGYTLLSNEYIRCDHKIDVCCPVGHKYSVKFSSFQCGTRCRICSINNQSSKGEVQVQQYIKSIGINVICNDRTVVINPSTGHNLELDIWIPSLNKAIEYNGLHWHSSIDVIKRDYIKKEQCMKLGIDLLVVHHHNWVSNRDTEIKLIDSFLGVKNANSI